ncbi:hypothetical protein ARMSODRAFT_248838 [Armillaria solidipes]|uniref:Uncharacterized protein n=1 Tax=Armillaria solidipes TaxID=1076256 RepID=A0A2H3CJD8_9AGAR|nr:hypothetical protein ARMSODRAFT_248838 [Armillaria solidipes]
MIRFYGYLSVVIAKRASGFRRRKMDKCPTNVSGSTCLVAEPTFPPPPDDSLAENGHTLPLSRALIFHSTDEQRPPLDDFTTTPKIRIFDY